MSVTLVSRLVQWKVLSKSLPLLMLIIELCADFAASSAAGVPLFYFAGLCKNIIFEFSIQS